jgi:PIN domain nuclease of toxin-antitoxin system
MRLLLDTHIALWAIRDDDRLSQKTRSLIDNPENAILASAASIWEIAITNRSVVKATHR